MRAPNFDGTIDVRVVLRIRVDPREWVEDMMNEHGDEVLSTEVRRDIKAYVRNLAAESTAPFRDVRAEGIYDS